MRRAFTILIQSFSSWVHDYAFTYGVEKDFYLGGWLYCFIVAFLSSVRITHNIPAACNLDDDNCWSPTIHFSDRQIRRNLIKETHLQKRKTEMEKKRKHKGQASFAKKSVFCPTIRYTILSTA